ncbi:5-oxoprolinase subunit B family protein [Flexivirga sp. B27]
MSEDRTTLTLRPFGARAVLVELPDAATRRALTAWLDATDHRDVDVIPAESTVLLDVSDLSVAEQDARRALARLGSRLSDLDLSTLPEVATDTGAIHTIPVRYDGPDLLTVAEHLAMSRDALIQWHTDSPWTVEFLGFMPGFGYLTRADHNKPMDRRESPRASIPGGSVGFAGSYCGIYPGSSPGGWQLIGSTDQVMFDATSAGATLAANDHVRFQALR